MTWFLVTIGLPVVLPILTMVVIGWTPLAALGAHWLVPIKDGQLCWLALAMSFSGLYELFADTRGPGLITGQWLTWVVLLFAFLILFSGLLAALGGLGTPVALPRPSGTSVVKHFAVLIASSAFTIISAAMYTVVHFARSSSS